MTGVNTGSRGAIRPVPATAGGGSALAGWLLTAAAVLLPVFFVAQWVDDVVADREQFAAVASAVAGQELTDAVGARITDDVMDRLALETAPRARLAAVAAVVDVSPAVRADPVRLRARLVAATWGQVQALVDRALVRQQVPRQWVAAASGLYDPVVAVVRATSDDEARARASAVTLRVDVQAAIAPARARLAALGLPAGTALPPVTLTLTSVDPDRLSQARLAFRIAHEARRVLPTVLVLLAGAGVALARRKWRAIATACLLGTVPLLAGWLIVRAGREAAPDLRSGSAFLDALVRGVAATRADALDDSFRAALIALVAVGVAAMLLAGSVGRFGSTSWMPPVVGYVPPRPRPGVRPDGRGPASTVKRPGPGQRATPGQRPAAAGQRAVSPGGPGQRPGAPRAGAGRPGSGQSGAGRPAAGQRPGVPSGLGASSAGSQAARSLAQLADRLAASGNRPPSGIVPGGPAHRRPER